MKLVKHVPHVPKLFKEIMVHHNHMHELFARGVLPFGECNDAIREMRRLRRKAEFALSWNTDKGRAV